MIKGTIRTLWLIEELDEENDDTFFKITPHESDVIERVEELSEENRLDDLFSIFRIDITRDDIVVKNKTVFYTFEKLYW